MQKIQQIIIPRFHYNYKSEGIILDSQYNYEGSVLATCNSIGEIYFYSTAQNQQFHEPYYTYNQNKHIENKDNNAILKIEWSLPILKAFASCNINKYISFYKVYKSLQKCEIQLHNVSETQTIPIYLTFCPSFINIILSVGFSNGQISLYNFNGQIINSIQAHQQTINSLSWQNKFIKCQKNEWISNNFIELLNQNPNKRQPMLLSVSSDTNIKIWYLKQNKLLEIGCKYHAHSKSIRCIQWKPNYLGQNEKKIVSCSQDGFVKIWTINQPIIINNDIKYKIILENKGQTNFHGPVYKASYNYLGRLIAICYCNDEQQTIQTKIMKQKNGILIDQIKIHN